jgi:transcriptional regulator with XRE-family HTH domain
MRAAVTQKKSSTVPEEGAVPDEQAEDQWLGWRVRQRRRQRQLSIRQLGDRTGLSVGMVSQIERGLSTPSLRSLRLLANALEVPVAHFFADSPQVATERRYIVRSHQRRRLNVPHTGVVQEVISPEGPGSIEIYELQLEVGASSGPEVYSHDGEKAGLVLSGTLGLQLGEEQYLLDQGDSFRFPSTMAHRFSNEGQVKTHLIWIVLAPVDKA